MTPWETVLDFYRFPERIGAIPFVPEPLQIESINELAEKNEAGIWLDMGTGKTFVSTACALFHRATTGCRCVVIMPPLLIRQWARWLRLISPALDIVEYRGNPKQRKALSLDADFVLVGVQIFKRDYDRFVAYFNGTNYCGIVDEATFVANINSANHEAVFEFLVGRPKFLLTGTPANNPADTYGLMKFTAPGVYRSKKHFENIHVEEFDFYDKPKEWKLLDVMNTNLMINSKRVLYQDMYSDIENPLYDPIQYDLDDDHTKLYRKLATEEMLKLDDGGKIEATSANKLRHALGQIVCNWGHFAGDPSKTSAAVEMIEEKLHALGSAKLVVFAHYKMTVRGLVGKLGKFGAVSVNSEVSEKQKDLNVQRFIDDPTCRVIVIQYVSGGKGLDGLQHACHTVLCIEPCQQPRDFHQAIARVQRRGQRFKVHVMLPVARGTLQVRGFRTLIENDTLINKVVRNAIDLRREIFGEDGGTTLGD